MKTKYFLFGYQGYCYKRHEIANSYIIEASDMREAKKIFKSHVGGNMDKYHCSHFLVNILTKERQMNLNGLVLL